jgi:hypothetical protein
MDLGHYRGALQKLLMRVRSRFRSAFMQLAIQHGNGSMRMMLPCEALRFTIFIDPYVDAYP